MASQFRLTAEEKNFFSLVNQAVLANPFSDERAETELKIVGMFPGVPLDELIKKVVAEVRGRLLKFEEQGKCSLNKFSGKDRKILMATCLFDMFYSFVGQFDQLIQEQIKAGEKSVKVRFADDVFSFFQQRGFDHKEALQYLALFYQLRRAYYFIHHGLSGRSPCMKKLRESLWNKVFTYDIDLYTRYLWNRMEDFSTLLLGETGTGKGAAAMAIGKSGFIPFDEKKGSFSESFISSFVSLNLSQFSENLIESELFGHKKGAFTGAVSDHEGVFDRCSPHGSIFLDEIGEVSIPIQIKLLKVLEERIYIPVGSYEEKRFKGRVIAATNRPVDRIHGKGLLRDDFFYRLSSDIILVPPLRHRIEEDPSEMDDLLKVTIERITGEPSAELVELTKKSIQTELGLNYPWPGNVRELAQCVRRILLNRSYGNHQRETYESSKISPTQLAKDMENGNVDAKNLLKGYCRHLYGKFGTYIEVARRTALDTRTVKKYIDEDE
jgi:DNA-binding NtrC family response regulator